MGKKKKTLNEFYFGEKEEQAVIDYINSDDLEEKNRIYEKYLKKPFQIMSESILRKYPIHVGNYEMEEIESYALSHLIEQMVKFKPETITKSGKKTKAFSYCQTIIRNYYKDHSKRTYNEKKINLPFDDYVDEIDRNVEYNYELEHNDEGVRLEELINSVVEKIEFIINNDKNIRNNEIIVGDAIVNILRNWNVLFLEDTCEGKYNKQITNKFAKNKILLFLKEQTGLSTKDIRLNIKPFKEIYFLMKDDFLKD